MPRGASSWNSTSWTTGSWRGPATARPRASPSPPAPSRASTTTTSAFWRGGGGGAGRHGEDLAGAAGDGGYGALRQRSGARVLRPRRRRAVLADPGAGGPRAAAASGTLPRQIEPVALLVGRLRSGVHAVLGSPGAAPPRGDTASRRLRHARGVLPRVHQRRMVAGERRRAGGGARVLRLRLSGAGGLPGRPGAPDRHALSHGDAGVDPAVRGRAGGARP